jgi:hypothetical protein
MSGTLRLTNLKFRAGPGPGKTPLEISLGTVLIFVGPNNAGKSLALREIETWCLGADSVTKVIDTPEIDFPTDPAIAEQLLREFEALWPEGQPPQPDSIFISQHAFREGQQIFQEYVSLDNLRRTIAVGQTNLLRHWLAAPYTVRLDGRNRFLLSDPQGTGDLQARPKNHLWALFASDASREQVRKLTEEAFGLHFVIDATSITQFRVRLSATAPASKIEEQGWDETARKFHARAALISEFSDGVKAFVGLIAAIHSLPHKVILIDEPDAFLHPPLARRLGGHLAEVARRRSASLVCATHSADFLMGALEAVEDASVVRLTYEPTGGATARTLSATELRSLMRDPLLRTTGVLGALFHRGVIVTESDTDRAFYDEINRRLLVINRGLRDSLILNAHNWQTIHRLVGPLRRIGIPAAGVADLDTLLDGGTDWTRLLDACQVPVASRGMLEAERAYLSGAFSALVTSPSGEVPIKSLGITALNRPDRARAEAFLDALAVYGLFLVPVGEVESWLRSLGVGGHASAWLTKLLSQIGQFESDSNYLKPGLDNVWRFLEDIARWVDNPKRLGTD